MRVFSRAAAERFDSQRLGDQYGTLLAGAWSLMSSQVPTDQEARTLIDQNDWEPYSQSTEVPDERRCIQRILQHQVRVETDDKTYTRTLGELVEANTRLFVVTDSDGGSYPWYHDVWAESWETDFSNATLDDFSCAPNRGRPGNALFILNRFLTNPVAFRDLAVQANANPNFLSFAEQCWAEGGQIPNFVTVDFVDEGALFEVVDALNDRAIRGAVPEGSAGP